MKIWETPDFIELGIESTKQGSVISNAPDSVRSDTMEDYVTEIAQS